MIFLFPSLAGYAVAVGIVLAISFALGVAGYFQIKGDAANYFVAGNSLPMWMVAIVRRLSSTKPNCGASCSSVLPSFFSLVPLRASDGNHEGPTHKTFHSTVAHPTHLLLLFLYCFVFKTIWSRCYVVGPPNNRLWLLHPSTRILYKFHYYDGAVIPIGLGLSLFLNSFILAGKINTEGQLGCLTLPDVLARRYGKIHEVLCSCTTIASFIMLLAGNLVGIGIIQAYVWNISVSASIWLAAVIVWVSVIVYFGSLDS
jgi:Sodium:solute symporter family